MKRLLTKIFLLTAVFVIASSSIPASTVAAIDKNFFSSNDIFFYDPDDTSCSGGQITTGTSMKIEKTATIETIYSYLTTTPLNTNDNKPLTAAQAAGIMGNMQAESSFNPSAIEDTSRTEKGHGLVQWTFGRWHRLESFAAERGTKWSDLNTQLEYLKWELQGPEKAVLEDGSFSTSTDPATTAMRFRIIFERADPRVAHDTRRQGAAIAVYNLFGGVSKSCTSVNGAVAGSIVKTALNYALDKPATTTSLTNDEAKLLVRDTYLAAKQEFNPSVDWTDCGGFVATVLYASGVDKKYPNVYVPTQIAYVKEHSEKYVVNENPTMADLVPGDILYIPGHTIIYTGEATYPAVDASWKQRVPSVRPAGSVQYMLNNGAISARVLK